MANPPFQVEGPPYPKDLPFYQTEALTWLMNSKNESALAGNRFKTTADAIEAVKKLYDAGAVRIDVVVTHLESWRREREGGDYADTLEVFFPKTGVARLLEVVRTLHPDNWEMDLDEGEDPYEDDGSYAGNSVPLSWD